MNRSSLLVAEQVTKPQEVNGTIGKAALPVTEAVKETRHSTDSDQDEGRDTDKPATRKHVTYEPIDEQLVGQETFAVDHAPFTFNDTFTAKL